MNRMACLTLAILVFGFAGRAAAQDVSLGDYAKKQRTAQKPASPTTKVWTNEDLPTSTTISDTGSDQKASNGKAAAKDEAKDAPKDAGSLSPEERAKQEADWKKKIADQKAKVASIQHDLDIMDREYKLRAIAWYTTTSKALLDQKNWSDQEKKYQEDKAAKEKDLTDAKDQLEKMRDDIRKAGFASSLGE